MKGGSFNLRFSFFISFRRLSQALTWLLYHFAFGHERDDPRADLVDEAVAILDAEAGGFDRFADADADGDRTDDRAPLPHRIAAALHGDRHDRRAGLDRH